MTEQITVSAVALFHKDTLLTVRKKGTELFQYPGGKPEVGESPIAAAIRETWEETGVTLQPEELAFVGEFSAAAANEPGATVVATLFKAVLPSAVAWNSIEPAAEIEEFRWVRVDDLRQQAPLMAESFPHLN